VTIRPSRLIRFLSPPEFPHISSDRHDPIRAAWALDHRCTNRIPPFRLSENPLFDAWLAAVETYRAERETLESSQGGEAK
jgi:hypothetical protein